MREREIQAFNQAKVKEKAENTLELIMDNKQIKADIRKRV